MAKRVAGNVEHFTLWGEHPEALKELKRKAKAVGLRVVVPTEAFYTDAQLFRGKALVAWVYYDPAEGQWGTLSEGARLLTPLGDVLNYAKDAKPKTEKLVISVDYGRGKVPELPEETLEAMKRLLPGKPKSVTVE